MKKLVLSVSFLAVMAAGLISVRANASPEIFGRFLGQQVLGSTRLSYGSDVDTVMTETCARGMAVDAIKIRVGKNDANIDFIFITLNNGQSYRLPVRQHFSRGSESVWFTLGGLRCIRSFTVYGDTRGLPVFKKAKVKLIGNAYSI